MLSLVKLVDDTLELIFAVRPRRLVLKAQVDGVAMATDIESVLEAKIIGQGLHEAVLIKEDAHWWDLI